jgi:hypothetical protein
MEKDKVVRKLILTAVIGVLLTGCGTSVPLKFRQCDMTNAKVLGESEGSSTGVMFGNVIPINQNTRFANAYEKAINKLGGTCLVDPAIEEKWYWAQILNWYTFKVKGTVVKEYSRESLR